MKTLYSLIRASIVIICAILVRSIFKIDIIISFVISFAIIQFLEEIVEHIIDVSKIKKAYSSEIAKNHIKYRISITIIHILTLIVWLEFVFLAIATFYHMI